VGGLERAKVAGAVGSSAVVVANVFYEHDTQVPLAEDQHMVGEFARRVRMNRSAKQFARGHRGGVRTRWMPTSARTASNDAVNCPARSRTRSRDSGWAHTVAQRSSGCNPFPESRLRPTERQNCQQYADVLVFSESVSQ
jgi:tryptophanyl-tRNA synthetase